MNWDQIVALTLIFQNVHTDENRYEIPPVSFDWKVHFNFHTCLESSFCDKRVNVMRQEKAYKGAPPDEFPKAFGYKSGARNDIFRFAS